MCHLARFLWQGFVVVGAGGEGVQRQVELIFPAEFKARLRHGVIADLRPRVAFRQIRRMSGNLVGNQSLLHVLFIWQAQCSFGVT